MYRVRSRKHFVSPNTVLHAIFGGSLRSNPPPPPITTPKLQSTHPRARFSGPKNRTIITPFPVRGACARGTDCTIRAPSMRHRLKPYGRITPRARPPAVSSLPARENHRNRRVVVSSRGNRRGKNPLKKKKNVISECAIATT